MPVSYPGFLIKYCLINIKQHVEEPEIVNLMKELRYFKKPSKAVLEREHFIFLPEEKALNGY